MVKGGSGPELSLIEGSGRATALVWPGNGARYRSLHRIELSPGSATVTQRHPGEAVYTILEGDATVIDANSHDEATLVVGAMVHVDPDTAYRFVAGRNGAVLVGGPCPPDMALYHAHNDEEGPDGVPRVSP